MTIRATCTLGISGDYLTVNDQGGSFEEAQVTERGGGPGSVVLGASEEDIGFGDITPGIVLIENIDANGAYAQIGPKNGSGDRQAALLIPPGVKVLIYSDTGVTWRGNSLYPGTSCTVQITAANV